MVLTNLVLTGLPTRFPKLVEAGTFAGRMFHILTLGRLTDAESRDAILKPVEQQHSSVRFTDQAVKQIVEHSGGYPYFIQFLCRGMFDSYLQQITASCTRIATGATLSRCPCLAVSSGASRLRGVQAPVN